MPKTSKILMILVMSLALNRAQNPHVVIFDLYRNLPASTDTQYLYFRSYISENIQATLDTNLWQIKENSLDGYWDHWFVGSNISRANTDAGNFGAGGYSWANLDTQICVFEYEAESLLATHKGYYAVITTKLRSATDVDSAMTCTLRAVPRPDTVARTGSRRYPIIRWDRPKYDTSTTSTRLAFNPIKGYSVWRCSLATGRQGPWLRLPPRPDGGGYQPYDTTRYEDTTAINNRNYCYAIRLVYHPVFIFAGPDTVRIESRLSESSFLVAVGVEETESPNLGAREIDLLVVPNPMKAKVRFQVDGSDNEAVALSIYSSSGQLVKSFRSLGRMTWNRRDAAGVLVPNGVYFVSLRTKDRILTKKLILE